MDAAHPHATTRYNDAWVAMGVYKEFDMPPELPIRAIQTVAQFSSDGWFEYPVRAHPHQTDYAGVVWHGSYLAWMEEARVEYLRSLGVDFENLVALGCDLPVVELSIRYRNPLYMGTPAILKSRILQTGGVKITWEQEMYSLDGEVLYIAAQVVNVPVDRKEGKILRRLPSDLMSAIEKRSATP